MENGQNGAIVPSNSSDPSDRSDRPMDQKVLLYLLFLDNVPCPFIIMVFRPHIYLLFFIGLTATCPKS
jgi:hypothetical protein